MWLSYVIRCPIPHPSYQYERVEYERTGGVGFTIKKSRIPNFESRILRPFSSHPLAMIPAHLILEFAQSRDLIGMEFFRQIIEEIVHGDAE